MTTKIKEIRTKRKGENNLTQNNIRRSLGNTLLRSTVSYLIFVDIWYPQSSLSGPKFGVETVKDHTMKPVSTREPSGAVRSYFTPIIMV